MSSWPSMLLASLVQIVVYPFSQKQTALWGYCHFVYAFSLRNTKNAVFQQGTIEQEVRNEKISSNLGEPQVQACLLTVAGECCSFGEDSHLQPANTIVAVH